ncbi:MAG: hypothetical protein AAGJ79_05720 [Verrucomicrobiota bacterium]
MRSPLPKKNPDNVPVPGEAPQTESEPYEEPGMNPDLASRLRELFVAISEKEPRIEKTNPSSPRTVRPVRDSNNLRDIGGVRSPAALSHYDRPPPVSKITSRLEEPGPVPQEVTNPHSKMAVIGVLSVVMLGGVLTFGAFALSQTPRSQDAPAATSVVRETAKIESLKEAGSLDTEDIARRFLKAATIEEKARLSRFPEASLEKIERYYGSSPNTSEVFTELHSAGIGHNGDAAFFLYIAKMESGELHLVAVLESERGGLAVDWDSFAKENPVSWTELVTAKDSTPVPMRVTLERSDYFNYDFDSANKWSSFRAKDADIDEPVYVYAAKGSLIDEEIQAEFRSKKSRQFILKLVPRKESAKTLQLEAVGMEQVGWVR